MSETFDVLIGLDNVFWMCLYLFDVVVQAAPKDNGLQSVDEPPHTRRLLEVQTGIAAGSGIC